MSATAEIRVAQVRRRKRLDTTWRFTRIHIIPRLLTLWAISIITFFATSVVGVDAARRVLGKEATARQLAAFRHEYGLDQPILQQYVSWLGNFLTGDWGVSPIGGESVREMVLHRLGPTLLLAVASLVVAVPLAIALGVFMAKRLGRPSDLALSMSTVLVAATPLFVLGIVLIYVFSVQLGWTPVDSSGIPFTGFWDDVMAYVLPVTALALSLIPHICRMTRASVRETLTTPYAQAAVLRGLRPSTITWRHLMPNAAGPIVNVVALDLMWLVGGVIIIENVFGFPGLGTLLVSSIQSGDVISVQAIAMVTGALFIFISFVADMLVLLLNPRLRTQ